MLPPIDQFAANIAQVKSLVAIASALDSKTTAAVGVDDVYRSAFVLSVSALDHYVHEKTVAGMLEIADGKRSATDAFGRFRIPLAALGPGLTNSADIWIEQEIRSAHALVTFQRSEAIADAVRLFHPTPLWPAVSAAMGMSAKAVKDTLDLIVNRRNKIAHEADCEPTGLGIKWPISETMVRESIDFLAAVTEAIESVV